jgi:daunorubicin resistance ABC transporter membrane protein
VNGTRYDRAGVSVLWRRDLLLFAKQRSRVVGAIATTLLMWLVIGAGIAPSFSMARGQTGYMEYFYPGMILMLMLQVSISATMSVIEDRNQGFLQGVLVAPGSRAALAVGKALGSTTVAMLHAALFLLLAPLAGFAYGEISWPLLLAVLALTGIGLTGVGFVLAWILDSVAGYHAVMNLVLFPLWILSGAMFPAEGLHRVMATLVRFNPMSYAMSGLRRALYGGQPPAGVGLAGSTPALEIGVLVLTAVAVLALAAWVARRNPINVR